MRSKVAVLILGAAWASASAQSMNHPGALKIDLPKDSPVAVVSADWGESSAAPRGGALVVDLHTALSLRNSTQRRIRGVTLIVQAQAVTPGGKASVSVPSLDIGPGETFPVKLDLRLLRPLPAAPGAEVEVGLDGVLFDDLSFYGPDKLNSRRTMTVWELEARRDRRYFKALLEQGGPNALQKEILASIGRQADRPQTGMQMLPRGRATNFDREREVQFAFLEMPDAPVEPMEGLARISGNEARAPRLNVRNRSDRSIKYLEIGWILKDEQGREFLAGSVPAELNLAPGKTSQVLEDATLRFPQRSAIGGMTGFVSSVEFSDGSYWIPSRRALLDPRLEKLVAPSPEEQRLLQIYRRKGLKGLVEELKKF